MSGSTRIERLKEKWGLRSNFQVFIILLVFSITGFSVLFAKPYLFWLVGFEKGEGWQSTILYLLLVFPLYQVLLLAYGALFGQFQFFLAKEIKLGKLLIRLLSANLLFRKEPSKPQHANSVPPENPESNHSKP
ncbi:MAG: DUF6787 family protein [Planctomycetota bacterium]